MPNVPAGVLLLFRYNFIRDIKCRYVFKITRGHRSPEVKIINKICTIKYRIAVPGEITSLKLISGTFVSFCQEMFRGRFISKQENKKMMISITLPKDSPGMTDLVKRKERKNRYIMIPTEVTKKISWCNNAFPLKNVVQKTAGKIDAPIKKGFAIVPAFNVDESNIFMVKIISSGTAGVNKNQRNGEAAAGTTEKLPAGTGTLP